ncbi:MAG: DUF1656 domain-containing protein [Hyphomicrobiaceae bacterium]
MMPKELSLGEVYIPPFLVAAALALILAWLTSIMLNRHRWTRFIAAPSVVFLSVTAIYTVLIGTFIILI